MIASFPIPKQVVLAFSLIFIYVGSAYVSTLHAQTPGTFDASTKVLRDVDSGFTLKFNARPKFQTGHTTTEYGKLTVSSYTLDGGSRVQLIAVTEYSPEFLDSIHIRLPDDSRKLLEVAASAGVKSLPGSTVVRREDVSKGPLNGLKLLVHHPENRADAKGYPEMISLSCLWLRGTRLYLVRMDCAREIVESDQERVLKEMESFVDSLSFTEKYKTVYNLVVQWSTASGVYEL